MSSDDDVIVISRASTAPARSQKAVCASHSSRTSQSAASGYLVD
jgi:hypothetical protein